MNKQKTIQKLATLSWEELDWLEQQCRAHKHKAGGGQIYSNTGDATHRAEAYRALESHFEDVFTKHHGV